MVGDHLHGEGGARGRRPVGFRGRALGQDVDLEMLGRISGLAIDHGVVQVDGGQMTSHPGIFAGGLQCHNFGVI